MQFSCFPVFPGSAEAQVLWGSVVKRVLIACFIGNISAKNMKICTTFTYVKVIASQRWDVFFWDTVHCWTAVINIPSLCKQMVDQKGWNQLGHFSLAVLWRCWLGWKSSNWFKKVPVVGFFWEEWRIKINRQPAYPCLVMWLTEPANIQIHRIRILYFKSVGCGFVTRLQLKDTSHS